MFLHALKFLDFRNPQKFHSVLSFNIEMLRMGCIAAVTDYGAFMGKLLVLLVATCSYLVLHLFVVIVCYRCNFKARLHTVVGGVGQVFMVAFLSITTTVLGPIQCMQNPNGNWTVRAYQTIVCWDSADHQAMVGFSALGMVIPLGFLAWCTWAVWNFPKQMRKGNTYFLRMYAFLFFRTRVEQYGYILVHMVRSLAISLTPVVPNIVGQIILMQLIMISQLAVTIHLKPWRIWQANALEAFFTTGVLVVVCTSAFFVESDEDDTKIISTFATIVVCIVVFAVPCMVLLGVAQWARLRGRKPFEFFICHYKAGEGSLARLLKMFLAGRAGLRRRIKANVFLDSDDLKDLSMLFEYVGNHSKSVLVIASSMLLTRPWCLGELVTARRSNVCTLSVAAPGYKKPDEQYITDYPTFVPDISCLAEHGISLVNVQEMLEWLSKSPVLNIPGRISSQTMNSICDWLMQSANIKEGVEQATVSLEDKADILPKAVSTVVHMDQTSLAANSAALILASLLQPKFANSPEDIPAVLHQDYSQLPQTTKLMVVLCTNGAFQQTDFLLTLWAGSELQVKSLPILADESFRFPGADFFKNNVSAASGISAVVDTSVMMQLVSDLFKAIAVVFQPEQYSATEEVLEAKTIQIAQRMANTGILQSLSSKNLTAGTAAVLEEKAEFEKRGIETNVVEEKAEFEESSM